MPNFVLTPSNLVTHKSTIINTLPELQARLNSLHPVLSLTLLREAITSGLNGREVSHASAPTAAGVQQWLKTVESLRTLLATAKWHIHQHQNSPFITSPNRDISIVVMTGSSETGKDDIDDPVNQAEKGAVTESFVERNSQLELFNQNSLSLIKSNKQGTQVWVLLYHYDKMKNEVRFELSFPIGFHKKKITNWGERLILGSIPNNTNDFKILQDESNIPPSVEVEPKTGVF